MRDFTEIERRMRLLIASLKEVLSDKEANEVLRFVDHGEYGVALEDLKYICDNHATSPATNVLNEMFDLARVMKIELEK